MRTFPLKTVSWLALIGAILLWSATWFFSSAVSKAEAARTLRILEQQDESLRDASLIKIRTIARSTKEQRTSLESLTNADVDSMLDEIEVISRKTGVKLEITQAFAEIRKESPLRGINFVISSEGSFERLVHASALLDLFPVPSMIQKVSFKRVENDTTAWTLEVNMRVLTSRDPTL
jgi:hypothetical protein